MCLSYAHGGTRAADRGRPRLGGTVGRRRARVPDADRAAALPRAAASEDRRRQAWDALFERPLSAMLEGTSPDDEARGIALTDATIGTFAPADDPLLRQNRCFLYHLIGNGTGRWDVPVGGMGALTEALAPAPVAAGRRSARRRGRSPVATRRHDAEVRLADGQRFAARHVLVNVAPAVLDRLLDAGRSEADGGPEGSQLKINMLLATASPPARPGRLAGAGVRRHVPRQRALHAAPARIRGGRAGRIPTMPPCELYCHSLTDPTILSDRAPRGGGEHADAVRAAHAGATVPAQADTTRQGDGGRRDAALAELGPRGADRGLPVDGAGRLSVPRGAYARGARGRAGDARRPHLPPRPRRGRSPSPTRVGTWGVETEHRERLAVRRGRPPRRRGQRDPRPQRRPSRAGADRGAS